MKKLIWIIIMVAIMITGCNKKEDEIDAQTQEKLNKFDRIIADIKSYQKMNKREVGTTIQDGIYIKEGERLNYYSVTALEGTAIADRVKIVVQIDKAPAEAKVVIGNKLVAFNEYKDLETLKDTGVIATTVITPDTIVYDVGAKIEETAVGGENKIVGTWARYNTEGDNLDQVLFLTSDGLLEYHNYEGKYFSDRGTYITTNSNIASKLEYNRFNSNTGYIITDTGKLKIALNGNELEFTRVAADKKSNVTGIIKYSDGTLVKGKIRLVTPAETIVQEKTIGSDGSYLFEDMAFPINWFSYRVKVFNELGKCIYLGSVNRATETNDIVIPKLEEEIIPAQEEVTLIKEITDSSNDELYSYPTAVWNGKTVFPSGLADIRALRVYSGSTTYEFEIEMGTSIEKLWNGTDREGYIDRILCDIYVSGTATGANTGALAGRNMTINNGYDKVITISPYTREAMKACALQENMVIPFVRSATGNKIRIVVKKSSLGLESINNIQVLSMLCEDLEFGITMTRTGATEATEWGFGGYTEGTNAFDMLGTNNKTNINMVSAQ